MILWASEWSVSMRLVTNLTIAAKLRVVGVINGVGQFMQLDLGVCTTARLETRFDQITAKQVPEQ